jgi:hypothetical protein
MKYKAKVLRGTAEKQCEYIHLEMYPETKQTI